jgi:hypothetical protein
MANLQQPIAEFLDVTSARMSLENGHENVLKLCDLALRGELAEAADLVVTLTSTGKDIPYDGIQFRTICAEVMFGFAEKIHPREFPEDRQAYFLEAIDHLTKVIEQDPQNTQAYERRAVAYQENLQLAAAANDYKQVVFLATDIKQALLSLWALKTLPELIPDKHESQTIAHGIGGYDLLARVVHLAATCTSSDPVMRLISDYAQQLMDKTESPDRWKLQICRVLASFIDRETEYATKLAHLHELGVLDTKTPEHHPFSFELTDYERQRLLECDGEGDANPWRGAFHEHSRTHSPAPINRGASKVFSKGAGSRS